MERILKLRLCTVFLGTHRWGATEAARCRGGSWAVTQLQQKLWLSMVISNLSPRSLVTGGSCLRGGDCSLGQGSTRQPRAIPRQRFRASPSSPQAPPCKSSGWYSALLLSPPLPLSHTPGPLRKPRKHSSIPIGPHCRSLSQGANDTCHLPPLLPKADFPHPSQWTWQWKWSCYNLGGPEKQFCLLPSPSWYSSAQRHQLTALCPFTVKTKILVTIYSISCSRLHLGLHPRLVSSYHSVPVTPPPPSSLNTCL